MNFREKLTSAFMCVSELTPMCHNILYLEILVYFIEILKKQKDYYKMTFFV